MVTVTKSVVQYGPDEAENLVFDKIFLLAADLTVEDSDFSREADYSMYYILAAQNPRAKTYCQGKLTEDKETWTDSPTLDPTRSELERWSYGRGTGPSTPGEYGNLDQYHGLLISQRLFGVSSEGSLQDIEFTNDGVVIDRDFSVAGDTLIPYLPAESSDVTIYEYPFVLEALPVPYSYKNPVDTDVYLRLSNYASELDETTVELYVDGEQQAGLTITPFVAGLGGLDMLWRNPGEFNYGATVEVEWRVDDKSDPPNTIIFYYRFFTVEDTIGPRVISQSPTDNETEVAIDSCVVLTIADYENTIDIASMEFYVNNIEVRAADVTTVTNDDGSTTFSYCPDGNFLYGDNIAVSFYIKDTADNYLFHVFNFETLSSAPPRSVENDPAAGEKNIPYNKNVEINIIGEGGGVDNTTIVVAIDGEEKDNPTLDPVVYRDD